MQICPVMNPLESHTEDSGPCMVTNDEAILVEVQLLSLQKLRLTKRSWVVAPGNHSGQHQEAAQHASQHQWPPFIGVLLLHRRFTSSSRNQLISRSSRDNLIHDKDLSKKTILGKRDLTHEAHNCIDWIQWVCEHKCAADLSKVSISERGLNHQNLKDKQETENRSIKRSTLMTKCRTVLNFIISISCCEYYIVNRLSGCFKY